MVSGTSVVVIHPNGDKTTTGPVAGYDYSSVAVSDTGTVYQSLQTSGTSGGSYESTVIVIRPDGTTTSPIVVDGLSSGLVFGPGGVAYLPTQSFSPSLTTTFTVIRPDGTYTTEPSIAGYGSYYGGGLVAGPDGNVYETTYKSGYYVEWFRLPNHRPHFPAQR